MPHSQRDEESHIVRAVQNCVGRRLLDIGAWDPIIFSNSRALLTEYKWGGVLIEPSPMPLRNLVKAYADRADIEILAGAVDLEPRLMNLKITDDAVSAETGSAQTVKWSEAGGYIGRMWIQTYTLEQIMHAFGGFDFVNIDTEGTSVDLFKALISTEMYPTCICVEHDGRIVEAMQAGRARGYHPVYESEENLVFAR